MLVIRFLRTGKKNQPFFRIVVTDKKNPPKGGRFLEILGFYNPLTKEKKIKTERIQHWISNGAQLSARVHNLLIDEGIIKGEKIDVHKKSKKSKEEIEEAPKEKTEGATTKEETSKEEPETKEEAETGTEKPSEEKEAEEEVKPETEVKEELKTEEVKTE